MSLAERLAHRPVGAPRRGREPLLYAAAAAVSSLVTAVYLRLWRADLSAPFYYGGDATAVLQHFQTVLERGWYEFQPRLGAPAGQVFHDFPTADNLHLAVARVLYLLVPDAASVMNAYYLVGFPLAALAAVWFLRTCGVSGALSVVLAVLYAVAPYHVIRNESHLWLASYYPVPLAMVVVLWAARGERLWAAAPGLVGRSRWLRARAWPTVGSLVLVASASTYYAAFTALMLGVAGVVALARSGRWRPFLAAVGAGAVLVAGLIVNMLPDMLYQRAHGANEVGLQRVASGVEVFGLKITSLILPSTGHRLSAFDDLRAAYDTYYPLASEPHALGLVASCGFLALLATAVVGLVALRRRAEPRAAAFDTLLLLATLNLAGLLMATNGGFASVVSFVTPNLRAWNRLSIVLALLSLAAVGLMVDQLVRAAARRWSWQPRRQALVALGVGVLVLGVGAFDQMISPTVPAYAQNAEAWQRDEQFFATLESSLPPQAMVFELPALTYPEGYSAGGVYPADLMKPFLHTDDLRWSAGGITGRPSTDWAQLVTAQDVPAMVDDLAVAGFAGILTNEHALAATSEVTAELADVVGAPVLESDDGQWAYYDLGGRADELGASNSREVLAEREEEVLEPVVLYPGDGLVAAVSPAVTTWTLVGREATMLLDNPRDQSVEVVVTATFSGGGDVSGIHLELGDVDLEHTFGADPPERRITVLAPPGRTTVTLSSLPSTVRLSAASQVVITDPRVVETDEVELAH